MIVYDRDRQPHNRQIDRQLAVLGVLLLLLLVTTWARIRSTKGCSIDGIRCSGSEKHSNSVAAVAALALALALPPPPPLHPSFVPVACM